MYIDEPSVGGRATSSKVGGGGEIIGAGGGGDWTGGGGENTGGGGGEATGGGGEATGGGGEWTGGGDDALGSGGGGGGGEATGGGGEWTGGGGEAIGGGGGELTEVVVSELEVEEVEVRPLVVVVESGLEVVVSELEVEVRPLVVVVGWTGGGEWRVRPVEVVEEVRRQVVVEMQLEMALVLDSLSDEVLKEFSHIFEVLKRFLWVDLLDSALPVKIHQPAATAINFRVAYNRETLLLRLLV
ncbi:hypothetical protein HAX54_019124 [Datura stramonium]|uniref:Uncharacterized protein n=1 Tax=Datura stramonium TaxID=4076 RepID=A0ABS8UQQ4_DATST|nr:hypothetical protein [Datura stramonium]